ncbi:MAG: hypothetical protein Q7S44_01540 [bacterium]|nr:hypothetical protein [bacterium]
MKQEQGTTLIEILLVSVIAVVVGGLLVAILVNNSGLFTKQTELVGEGLNLNDGIRQIDDGVREAAGVVVSYEVDSTTYTTGDNTLVLKLPATSGSGVISDAYDYLVVSADTSLPQVLRLQVFPDAQSTRASKNIVLSTILNSVQFYYLDESSAAVSPSQAVKVKVILSVIQKSGQISSSRSATMTTSLRNAQ